MVLGDLCCLGGFVKALLCSGLEGLGEQCGGPVPRRAPFSFQRLSGWEKLGACIGKRALQRVTRQEKHRRHTARIHGDAEASIWAGCSGDVLNLPCSEGQIGMGVQRILWKWWIISGWWQGVGSKLSREIKSYLEGKAKVGS